jgi:hypothetical protein
LPAFNPNLTWSHYRALMRVQFLRRPRLLQLRAQMHCVGRPEDWRTHPSGYRSDGRVCPAL